MALHKSETVSTEIMAISWMSFFWSVASLMVFSVLPVFLSEELGISHTHIGLIEGLAIGASFGTKVLSGVLSDLFQKRKPFILLGSILSTLSKPLFALSSTLFFVLVARFVDRISKGVRSAPTDAYLADISTKKNFMKTFSLRQSLYTFGAVFGAFLSMVILYFDRSQFRMIFWLSMIPNVIAIGIFLRSLRKTPEITLGLASPVYSLKLKEFKNLPPFFWQFLIVLSFLMVARFSEAFLTLYAKEFGCPNTLLPLIIIIMDIIHASFAAYSGHLTNRFSSKSVLLFGLFFLIFTNVWFFTANSLLDIFLGISFVGIHMGLTQGLIKSILAEHIPKLLRGSCFAIFYLASGVCILFGNLLAGALSDHYGLKYVFLSGGVFSLLSFLALGFLNYRNQLKIQSAEVETTV